MDTRTARSTAEIPVPVLYFHQRYECFECMGCGEYIEVPAFAVLRQNRLKVPIKENPENLLIWRELMEADHAKCSSYADVAKALDARKFRRIATGQARVSL